MLGRKVSINSNANEKLMQKTINNRHTNTINQKTEKGLQFFIIFWIPILDIFY